MISELFVQKYNDFPVNEKAVLRYAGCFGAKEDSDVAELARKSIEEVNKPGMFSYKLCYRVLDIVDSRDDFTDFEVISAKSLNLARLLNGCDKAVFMAATIGHDIDRYINRYGRIDPAKALFYQAIGAERVETMLDAFCSELPDKLSTLLGRENILITSRYSPGYGDLPLQMQPEFLTLLDTSRKIGITINDSLLMSPSKSVTAIVGVRKNEE